MITGWPPSWAMPTSNDTRVRVDALSNSTATERGPASGREPNGSAFIASARSSTAPLLVRAQLVVAQQVPDHGCVANLSGVQEGRQRGQELAPPAPR